MAKVSRSGETASRPEETGMAQRESAARTEADSMAGKASAAPTIKCVIAEAIEITTIQEFPMRILRPWLTLLTASGMAVTAGGADPASVRRLRADLNFLCSDVLAGRLSLDRSADVAALYIAAEFERAGLKPASETGFLQPFPLVAYDSDPRRSKLRLTSKGKTVNFRPGPEFRGGYWKETEIKA